MPRDEEGRRRARKHARVALIVCVAMLGALTPVLAAVNRGSLEVANAQDPPDPCEIIEDPTGELCPTTPPPASGSPSPSRSASASSSPSATRSPSASSGTSPSATSTSSSPSAGRTPTPTRTSPSPTVTRTPQTFNASTKVSIKVNRRKAKFSGKISSDFAECVAGRRVKLFYVVPGFGTTRPAGKTKSKASGTWAIDKKKAKGKYFASAPARRIRTTAGDTINCRKGKSKQVKA